MSIIEALPALRRIDGDVEALGHLQVLPATLVLEVEEVPDPILR